MKDKNMIGNLDRQIQQIEQEREELLKTVSDRENKIKNLMGINLDLQSEIKELNQQVEVKNDLYKHL